MSRVALNQIHRTKSRTRHSSALARRRIILKAEIAEGTIVAVSTEVGMRVSNEEMIVAAMRTWPQAGSRRFSATTRRG
jgi:hypothetical protein